MTPRHAEARRLAQHGIPVFPCVVNGKKPATPNGFQDATCDVATIDLWWGLADYNLGFSPASVGQCVIDIDGATGENNWFDLEVQNETAQTYTVTTPSGGRHLYFGGDLPPSASRLAGNIDTRGRDSYVLVPPSVVDGIEYVVTERAPVRPLPGWILALMAASRTDQSGKAHTSDGDADQPTLDRVREILRMAEPAVEGAGSDEATLKLANLCMDFVSPMKALELMWEHWVPRCVGEWTEDWVEEKVKNALTYRDLPVGCDYVAPLSSVFGQFALADGVQDVAKKGRGGRFVMRAEEDMDATPELDWLVPEVLPRGALAVMFGTTGSFKSFIAGTIGMGYAAGCNILDRMPGDQGVVVYAAGEGARGMKLERRRAWKALNQITTEMQGRYFITEAPYMFDLDEAELFKEALRALPSKPHLIFFDTFTEMMAGLEEFNLKDISRATMFAKSLIAEFGCTVVFLAHTNEQGGMRGGKGPLWASADTVLEIERGEDKAMWCAVKIAKQKDATEDIAPIYMKGVELAGSLAFQPMTRDEQRTAKKGHDDMSGPAIGTILKRLSAVDADSAITTDALAMEVMCGLPNMPRDVDKQAEVTGKIKTRLKKLAKDRLAGYCEEVKGGLAWYLRARPEEPQAG